MEPELDLAWFTRQLRTILSSLYDPAVIHNSPLTRLFEIDQRRNPMFAMQYIVLDAIEALKPAENTPHGSRNWRVYHILRRRYSEQATQREVATELGLGVRQMQREENLARKTLAEYLWTTHNLQLKTRKFSSGMTRSGDQPVSDETHVPSRAEELERLRELVPVEKTDINAVLADVLSTLAPSSKSWEVTLLPTLQEELPTVWLRKPLLRQALLSLVSKTIRCVPGGKVYLDTAIAGEQIHILVHPAASGLVSATSDDCAKTIQMAERLLQLCRGSLEVVTGDNVAGVLTTKIILPAARQVVVLVIDDNADTRQLFQRYLTGSQYRFVGAEDAAEAWALVDEMLPQIIVLDVMMPDQDGWALLGRLREHPQTSHVPVIVCSILPDADLARDLGAADFIRKPVKKAALLSALDRQLVRMSSAP
ncbi:MAG: response regulator [Anaerolineae bacterium]|nr:response regulator [Anaerolineae bacterium]